MLTTMPPTARSKPDNNTTRAASCEGCGPFSTPRQTSLKRFEYTALIYQYTADKLHCTVQTLYTKKIQCKNSEKCGIRETKTVSAMDVQDVSAQNAKR